jgi:hypothetical protein
MRAYALGLLESDFDVLLLEELFTPLQATAEQ